MFRLLSLLLILTCGASGHSGDLDWQGGHYDNSTGLYHSHDGASRGQSSSSIDYSYDSKRDAASGGLGWFTYLLFFIGANVVFLGGLFLYNRQ